MIGGLHEGSPATDNVLFVDITAPLHQQLRHIQATRHGRKHQRSGAILRGAGVLLTRVLV